MRTLRAAAAGLAAIARSGYATEEVTRVTADREMVMVTLHIDARRLLDQTQQIALNLEMLFAAINARTVRDREQRRLEAARRLQANDPRIDIEVRTGEDGVCRVAVRRLGGWDIPPGQPLGTRIRDVGARAGNRPGFPPFPAGGSCPPASAGSDVAPLEPPAGAGAGNASPLSADSGGTEPGDQGGLPLGSPDQPQTPGEGAQE